MTDLPDPGSRYEREFERDVITRLARIETNAAAAATTTLDHEVRLRDLEKLAWRRAGAVGVISFTLALVGEWFSRHFNVSG